MAMALIANDSISGLDTNVARCTGGRADGAGQDLPMSDRTIFGRAFVGGELRDGTLITHRRRTDHRHPRRRASARRQRCRRRRHRAGIHRRSRARRRRRGLHGRDGRRGRRACAAFTRPRERRRWRRRRSPASREASARRGDDDRARVARRSTTARRSAASISKVRTSTSRAPARRTSRRSVRPTFTSSRRCWPRRRICAG